MTAIVAQRPGLTLVALSSCGVAVALQQTIVIPILPRVTEHLGTSPANGSWLIIAGLLSGSVATPVISRLADLYGRRRLLLTLGALLLGSLVGAVTTTLPLLLTARALQGMSVALIR